MEKIESPRLATAVSVVAVAAKIGTFLLPLVAIGILIFSSNKALGVEVAIAAAVLLVVWKVAEAKLYRRPSDLRSSLTVSSSDEQRVRISLKDSRIRESIWSLTSCSSFMSPSRLSRSFLRKSSLSNAIDLTDLLYQMEC
jgi:hypothetical protein